MGAEYEIKEKYRGVANKVLTTILGVRLFDSEEEYG